MGGDEAKVKHLNTVAEYEEILKSPKLIIDFTAKWCPPCKRIAPFFENLASENEDIVFAKVDVDDLAEVANNRENISSMPTFKFYHNGAVVATLTGADQNKLRENLKKLKEL